MLQGPCLQLLHQERSTYGRPLHAVAIRRRHAPRHLPLFLTGVTLAFLMDSTERKGLSPAPPRLGRSQPRRLSCFGIAFAIPNSSYGLSRPSRQWSDLTRVDILELHGLLDRRGVSGMALFRTAGRVSAYAPSLGTAIAVASPLWYRKWIWNALPGHRQATTWRPVSIFFGFFPWAAFLALRSQLRQPPAYVEGGRNHSDHAMDRDVFGSGHGHSEPILSLPCRLSHLLQSRISGSIVPRLFSSSWASLLVAVSFAYIWTLQPGAQAWSWVRQFGTTSLLVYWVHIELVYGRWLGFWKDNLTIGETTLCAAFGITVSMLWLIGSENNLSRSGRGGCFTHTLRPQKYFRRLVQSDLHSSPEVSSASILCQLRESHRSSASRWR